MSKKSAKFLPEYLKTDKNKKFLSSTFDHLIQTPELERLDGYIGSKITPNFNVDTDFYIEGNTKLRNNYDLEPALVLKNSNDNIQDVIAFDDFIYELGSYQSKTENLDKLLRPKFYSFDPYIEWDKLVNYFDYYWLPQGPDTIIINEVGLNVDVEIIGNVSYSMPFQYVDDQGNTVNYKLSNGMKVSFGTNVTPIAYRGNTYYVEGVGSSIYLVDIRLLENNEDISEVYNETFDSDGLDEFPFDGDKRLPLTPEYITINRGSRDLNPWTRYNRWFHKDIIRLTGEINNLQIVYQYENRAKRPIVEFKANLKLYNFGTYGIQNVDLLDNDTTNIFSTVQGAYGYYVDNTLIQSGNRVIFNADQTHKNKIFRVSFTTGTTSTIVLTTVTTLSTLSAAVSVNYGIERGGTSWFFDIDSDSWKLSQQHDSINQAPLFDVFDSSGISFANTLTYKSNFLGTKIFGYDIGIGANDSVLGFPLKFQNSSGIGSFLFKNYFMTDTFNIQENNLSSEKSVSVTYLKNYHSNDLLNVWQSLNEYQLPIVEIQVTTSTTSTLSVNSINKPIDINSLTSVRVYKNDSIIRSTFTASSTSTKITLEQSLEPNELISIKLLTSQIPNHNGYYETPLSLSNNPLNGPVVDFTLSELRDHLNTMVDDINSVDYDGTNLRDIDDYTRNGTRIVVNANPISFAKIFLGKKENNLVDALRLVGNQYTQFKNNFLRKLNEVSASLTAVQALDYVIESINLTKDFTSAYYRSDMIGYGDNKSNKTYTVSNTATTVYPIGLSFDLLSLSHSALYVYLNGSQLIYDVDYEINVDEVTVLAPLTVNDTIEITYFNNTLGCFIPPTPTKLGLYPKFVPKIYSDNTFIDGPVSMIRGHDGSLLVAFGDYRDNIILELEKRIYNNIKVEYKPDIYDVKAGFPGAFRNKSRYSQIIDILSFDFFQWAGVNSVDYSKYNLTYDNVNSFTWNLNKSIDTLFAEPVPRFWRGVYNYFFDTDRPHTNPWEMLGFSEKPSWWDTHYEWVDSGKRADLIAAIEQGKVSNPSEPNVYNPNYARPNFASINPVSVSGDLLSPTSFVTINNDSERQTKWYFGDGAPAETAWRNSSYWPFAVNIVSLLLNPGDYASKLFDTSRIQKNVLDQITYKDDDLYLDPRKIVLDGEDNNLSSGYSVFVIEAGKQKDQGYIEKLRQDLTYLNFNLFHKLGGFTAKEKLQINIDSVDPVSTSPGLVLPFEDYSLILNVSNPVKIASASGMIIQKSNGKFVIKGYDLEKPYFDVLLPDRESKDAALTIGGTTETFTEWSGITQNKNITLAASETATAKTSPSTRFYKEGQVVRYNGKFYRCKVGHNPSGTFDASLWGSMVSLPSQGGVTVQTAKKYQKTVTRYSYGSEISSIQEMYDILIGYGAYLESEGFQFNEYSTDLSAVLNWKYSASEFLFWCTQNWADNNLITLSPFAEAIQYSYSNSVVDNVIGKYSYSLLKADGKPFPVDNITLIREDGKCTIKTKNTEEGLFFVKLVMIQKEHALVFNNLTVFNDTIYDIETGYKQRRMKLAGFRTKNWNGDLYSPGFLYDNFDITDWESYKTYGIGDIVRYNGSYYQANKKIESNQTFEFSKWTLLPDKPVPDLLPNFDYKIAQFEDFYSLDVDNFDATQQKLAQHLIGYTPRTYFNNIFTNPISQYKFYQGFIKDKGTKNAIDKLSKATRFLNKGEVSFNEEWAFRTGFYGGFSNYEEIEFPLVEGTSLENPYLITFSTSKPNNASPLINYITPSDLLLKPEDYDSANVFTTVEPDELIVPNETEVLFSNNVDGTYNDVGFVLTSAGYVRLDDVTTTAYNKNSLLDIARNNQIQNRSTIWTGFLENGSWSVYRYTKNKAKVTGVFVSSPGASITFSTSLHHGLSPGDIVSIVNFNDQVNGVYIVDSIPQINQFTVSSVLTSIVNDEQLAYGNLFVFEVVRYSNLNELKDKIQFFDLDQDELIWVDIGLENKWHVYAKQTNYPVQFIESANTPPAQELGHTIWASERTSKFLVSAPNFNTTSTVSYGRVKVFDRENETPVKLFEYTLNSFGIEYCNPAKPSEFGYSMAYDRNKNYIIVGAPKASNVKGVASIEQAPSNVLFAIDILVSNSATVQSSSGVSVSTNGFLVSPDEVTWSMTVGVTTSSIYSTAGTFTSSARIFDDEGIVKISSIGPYNDAEQVEAILTNPLGYYTTSSDRVRFGHSVYINEVNTSNNTLLLVSAPGTPYVGDQLFVTPTIVTWTGTTAASSLSIYSTATSITTGTIGNVYSYLVSKTTGIRINFPASGINVFSTSTVDLKVGDQWGYKVSGNSTGTYLAVSAPGYLSADSSGIVQIFRYTNNRVTHYQTLNSPYGTTGNFGKEHVISYTGKYLIVSAPDFRNLDTSFGNVTIYTLNSNNFYTVLQTIKNPVASSDLKFGHSLSLNENEDKLLISGLGTNRSVEVKFDVNTQSQETTFDGGTTKFVESIPDSGAIYAYQRLGQYFVPGHELTDSGILEGSKYGFDVVSTDRYSYVGAPFSKTTLGIDNSKVFIFDMPEIFAIKHKQPNLVDIKNIERVALIDSLKEETSEYIEIIDPLKGKISGLAEQEIKYKSPSDPAIYSIGRLGNIVDDKNNWLDEHIGDLWWDLSTIKYVWYEQGEDLFRKNNWGKVFPGATIDVYEWVRSDLLPSAWAAQADTNAGSANGISGQPKHPANDVVSVKQIYNSVTGSFENVYYFWVKNKLIIPNVKNRRLSAYQVASIIADPQANGIKYASILSGNSVAFANIQPLLIDNRINCNISFSFNNQNPRHTEWILLSENKASDVPNTILEKKLIDSLLGEDINGNPVPDSVLTYRNRYGIGIRPQQTLFKDRKEALRNCIKFINDVFKNEQIVGKYYLGTLLSKDEIPDVSEGKYDELIDSVSELAIIDTSLIEQAQVSCTVQNGKIDSINIINSGSGYKNAPNIIIKNNLGAQLKTVIDNAGSVISVEIENPGFGFVSAPILTVRPYTVICTSNPDDGGRWTVHEYKSSWVKFSTQKFRTEDYWDYIDWYSADYNEFKVISYVVDTATDLALYASISNGLYIRVNNNGNGKYAIVEKVSGLGNYTAFFNIVFLESGTIQILNKVWDDNLALDNYDELGLSDTSYDQSNTIELRNIFTALKNDIFIDDLKVNWNKLFFVAVRYALSEQKLLDWTFKTSFINVVTDLGNLDQRPVYKLDNERYFEDYIKEIKPYHSQIRNYISKYNSLETYNGNFTDFDLPTYYNQTTGQYQPVTILAESSATTFTITNTLTNVYPWKNWTDNYTYFIREIIVHDGGAGYTQRPIVSINAIGGDFGSGATAEAYIRGGSVYKIVVTNPGSGYTKNCVVALTQSGSTRSAVASVVLGNDTIRKNRIGLRFDRVSKEVQITDEFVFDKFTTSGEENRFVLTWLANPDKSLITITLDGKLVLSTDYILEYYKSDYEGYYTKEYTRIVLLNTVPSAGQILKIRYKKNIKLLTAVDRIEQFYNPQIGMLPKVVNDLVSGLDYPLTTYEGMKFADTAPWGTTTYDTAPWDDIVSEMITVKLLQNVDTTATILNVNTTTGITTGQSIVIGNTSSIMIRQDTVVTAINTALNQVTISSPTYDIKKIVSTDTTIGSVISVTTKEYFRGALRVGDNIEITGVITTGYNGIFVVTTCTNNTFNFTATQVLNSTTTQLSTPSRARVLSVLSTISSTTSILDRVIQSSTGTSTAVIHTYALYSQLATATVTFSSGAPTWYVSTSSGTVHRVVVNIAGLNPATLVTATVTLYGYTDIEFWKYNLDPQQLTVNLDGGSYANGVNTSALGSTATDNIVQGGGWIKPIGQYYGYALNTTVPGSTATYYAGIIDKFYLRYLYRHADQGGLDFWVNSIILNGSTIDEVETAIKLSAETTATNATFNPDGLINPFRSYAPEEYVPGHTQDSLSMSVYTRPERISPIMFNGAIFNVPFVETTATLTLLTDEIPAGLLVTFNGQLLTRDTALPLPGGLDAAAYFLEGNKLTVAAQSVQGRIGYSYITAGSSTGLDSRAIAVYSTTTQTATLISDMPYNGVSRVYVELDTAQILPYSTSSSAGYTLIPVGTTNKRASIQVTNIPAGRHDLVGWFFRNNFETINRIREDLYIITTSTTAVTLVNPPSSAEPKTAHVIVEKMATTEFGSRVRLLPPDISYYKVVGLQKTFDINNKKTGLVYNNQNVKVYINGFEIRPGFDFSVNPSAETITIVGNIVNDGDVIAIMDLTDYDYVIFNNILYLKNAVTTGVIKLTSFNNHDSMGIRTERFDFTFNNEYKLSLPIISENFIWVNAGNKSLIYGFDYFIKPDMQTIVLGDNVTMTAVSEVMITTVNPSNYSNKVIAYRLFKDIFDRQSFKRLSRYFRTRLSRPLNYFDKSIHVEDGSVLFSPNPNKNIPGIVFIDGERIEYFVKNGNELSQLRRGTFATGTPWYSAEGTLVFDQSIKQNVSNEEVTKVQLIPSGNTSVYEISTVTSTSTFSVNTTTHSGAGIVLISTSSGIIVDPVNQVEVYYGGRRLRKQSLKLHYNDRAYDTTSSVYYNGETTSSYEILPPEFTIQVSATQVLLLNINEDIVPGTQITVVQRLGRVWDITTASILSSTSTQAKFLGRAPAELPSEYYYGGNLELTDENNNPLTEDDGDTLQGL